MNKNVNVGLLVKIIIENRTRAHATFTASLLPKSGAYDVGQFINLTAVAGGTTTAPPYTYTLYDDSAAAPSAISSITTSSTSTQFQVVADTNDNKYLVSIKDSKPSGKASANSTAT